MSTSVRDFWFAHPQYWIAIGKTQEAADKTIYAKFRNCDFLAQDKLGQIIYLDQFLRHFSRIEPISEEMIKRSRHLAAAIAGETNLLEVTETELVWYLMPWKHLSCWDPLFGAIESWVLKQGTNIVDYPLLNKFFMDSYTKAYDDAGVALGVSLCNGIDSSYDSFDWSTICESYTDACLEKKVPAATLVKALCDLDRVIISLSGGVDSMLMAALLVRAGVDVVAAHIVYGNRAESAHEHEFIRRFCNRIGIKLYSYKIKWLRRDGVDRAFYEKITRSIRFSVYKAIGDRPVLLGHIQDDVVENILTNFAKGTHLDDLAKFKRVCQENGVNVVRPWLNTPKHQIYKTAALLGIPYLKNTTPVWSNRGKFRGRFYNAVLEQYGADVDTKLIEVAERYRKQAELLDKLLFQKILDSWNAETRELNITQGVSVKLDADGWLRIFSQVCQTFLKVGRPSYSACNEFAIRVSRGLVNKMVINMTKLFQVVVLIKGEEVWLQKVN